MKVLVICIEMLAWNSYIEISSNYIISYNIYPDQLEIKKDIYVLDMNTGITFCRDSESINTYTKIKRFIKDDKNITLELIESKKQDSNILLLNMYNEKYLESYIFNEHSFIQVEKLIADVPLIDKYIGEDKFKSELKLLGSSYNKYKKYSLQNIEVTHNEPVLIFQVKDIYEQDSIDIDLLKLIDKIKSNDILEE